MPPAASRCVRAARSGPAIALPDVVDAARADGAQAAAAGALPRHPRRSPGQAAGRVRAGAWPTGITPAATPRCIRSRSTSTAASPARWPRTRGEGFGLEAGSKPELMAVLALSRPGGLIVCNGYKDREYIRLALIGRKLGLRDLHRHREAVRADAGDRGSARARRASRGLGVRMRLASLGAGKWQNSGGDKAKFGLSPRQVLDLWKQLRDAGMTRCARACCISTWARRSPTCATSPTACARRCATSSSCRSSARRCATWTSAAAWASTTRARARAATARSTTASTSTPPTSCSRWPKPAKRNGLPPPRIVTECGRAMTAHHAVLVANVSEVEQAPEGRVPPAHADEPAVIRHLRELHDELDARPAVELFHEAQHHHGEGLSLYALGQIDLAHRARIDDLFYAIAHAVRARLDVGEQQPSRPARRIERAPGRQVLRQLQRVRIDARTSGRSTRCSRSCRSSASTKRRRGAA